MARAATVAVLAMIAATLTAATAASADDAPTTVSVTPAEMHGWEFNDAKGNGGTGKLDRGASHSGNGSAHLVVTGIDQGYEFGTTEYNGILISDLADLSYWAYNVSNEGPPTLTVALNIGVDYDGNGTYDGRLVFDPSNQVGAQQFPTNQWQQLTPYATGQWYAYISGSSSYRPTTNPCPQTDTDQGSPLYGTAGCKWASTDQIPGVLGEFPNARVSGGIFFKTGSGWLGFDGYIDDFTLGVSDGINISTDIYDFDDDSSTWHVGGTSASDANDCTADEPCATIAAAIGKASAGDTIEVGAGTYIGPVLVNKSLTIRGPNAGLDPNASSRGAEAIIDATDANDNGFSITADDVTIDGFTIKAGAAKAAIVYEQRKGHSGAEITNNILYAGLSAITMDASDSAVEGNLVYLSSGTTNGILSQAGTPSGWSVAGNHFRMAEGAVINSDSYGADINRGGGGLATDITIVDNVSESGCTIVAVTQASDVTISDNVSSGTTACSAIYLGGTVSSVSITGNILRNVSTGLKFGNFAAGYGATQHATVTDNACINCTVAVAVASNGYDGELDVSSNYWGSPAPEWDSLIADDRSDGIVAYEPWFVDYPMTILSDALAELAGDGSATVTADQPQVSVPADFNGELVVTVADDAQNAGINFGALKNDSGSVTAPATVISTGSSGGGVGVAITAATEIAAADDAFWDGVVKAPALVAPDNVPAQLGASSGVVAVTVGSDTVRLTFSKPVQLTLPGQAGKRAAWVDNDGLVHEIDRCAATTEPALTEQLQPDGECFGYSGSDLVIWTMHFTMFASYRAPVTGGADQPASFRDVPAQNEFFDDIAWLAKAGVTKGYVDGGFHPAEPVTRQAMAAFLFRMAHPGVADPVCLSSSFADVARSGEFCGVIAWLAKAGVTKGYVDGGFHPAEPVTRQAMAAFLFRMAHPGVADPVCLSSSFADVARSGEFCGVIAWLAKAGVTKGYVDGGFHPAEPVTRQAMAAFLHRMSSAG